jgi:hypothetical protein
MPRLIHEIAADVLRTWTKATPEAREALEVMAGLELITDDDARESIERFLRNARFFAGKNARRLKAEFDAVLNSQPTRGQFLRRSQMAARRQLALLRAAQAEAAP